VNVIAFVTDRATSDYSVRELIATYNVIPKDIGFIAIDSEVTDVRFATMFDLEWRLSTKPPR
jgi:hypothetical protein